MPELKLDGTEGQSTNPIHVVSEPGGGQSGQQTMANSQSVVIASNQTSVPVVVQASEAHGGEFGGNTDLITPTITVTAAAYSVGHSIGGKITLTGAMRISGGRGILNMIKLYDRANQKPTGTIIIFESNPVAATITDRATFVYSTDDTKGICEIPIATSDWTTINSKAQATLKNLGLVVKAVGSADLYAVFVTTSTPTFAATTDFGMRCGFLRD